MVLIIVLEPHYTPLQCMTLHQQIHRQVNGGHENGLIDAVTSMTLHKDSNFIHHTAQKEGGIN